VAVVDAATGRVLGEVERRERLARMDLLTDSVAVGILNELRRAGPGEAVPRPAVRATSLEALKSFLRGEQFFRLSRWDSAASYYERAVADDPALAPAYRRLGDILSWTRVSSDSASSALLLRAGSLNHGWSPRDSLLIRIDSLIAALHTADDALVTWNVARRLIPAAREVVRRYPGDPEAWFAAGEATYHFARGPAVSIGEPAVLDMFRRAIALDPAFAPAYQHAVELALNAYGADSALRYARAYLAHNPTDVEHGGILLLDHLLDPAWSGRTSEPRRMLDTASAQALSSARTTVRRWPDSSELALRLSRLLAAGRPSPYPLFADTMFMRKRLADELGFRGHVREAYRTLGEREVGLFVDLAYLGAVPDSVAEAAFRRWLEGESGFVRLVPSWWSARRDTAMLETFARWARRRLREDGTPGGRLEAGYDTASAQAHLALVRGDTLRALDRFRALPDSGCVFCYLDRFTRACLEAARGDDAGALADLSERLPPYATGIEVLFAIERARVARRLGRGTEADAAERFAAAAWSTADSGLAGLLRRTGRGEGSPPGSDPACTLAGRSVR
jgi:serine/threonine-protein kinase